MHCCSWYSQYQRLYWIFTEIVCQLKYHYNPIWAIVLENVSEYHDHEITTMQTILECHLQILDIFFYLARNIFCQFEADCVRILRIKFNPVMQLRYISEANGVSHTVAKQNANHEKCVRICHFENTVRMLINCSSIAKVLNISKPSRKNDTFAVIRLPESRQCTWPLSWLMVYFSNYCCERKVLRVFCLFVCLLVLFCFLRQNTVYCYLRK